MVDLSINCGGIKSPNPFWLASAPPSNSAYQVCKAFETGWGGAVWKTIGEPVMNVFNRYGAVDYNGQKILGLNNIELISDRPIEDNLREIAEVKKRYPKHLVIASLMVESKRESWHEMVRRSEDAGSDALELSFGCPHGMSERGMGSAVGQVPEYAALITSWVKEVARTPVLVKLTPNVSDIVSIARAAVDAGADALTVANTMPGMAIDVRGRRPVLGAGQGGLSGPAIKPIALRLVYLVSRAVDAPVIGCGGIASSADALEFIMAGARAVQMGTAIFVDPGSPIRAIDGIQAFMEKEGVKSISELVGAAWG